MHNEKIKKNAIDIYNESSSLHGTDTLKAVHWEDEQKIFYRYNLICNHISLDSNNSILDVGCGNGAFFKYLNFVGFRGDYIGYDINENLIDSAKKKFSSYKDSFKVVDILNDTNKQTFDYVVVCGLFNTNYGQDFDWICEFLEKLYSLANKKVVFNAISTYTNFKQNSMYYIDPLEVSDFIIKNISHEMILEHGKLPYNFQIIINKDRPWQSLNSKTKGEI